MSQGDYSVEKSPKQVPKANIDVFKTAHGGQLKNKNHSFKSKHWNELSPSTHVGIIIINFFELVKQMPITTVSQHN